MSIQPGERIPSATLNTLKDGVQAVSTAELFDGRKVVLFSVPGAFTPTCSAAHLPSFVNRADELRARGVDEIACTAVNDAFVMGAWSKAADAGDAVTGDAQPVHLGA